MQSSTAWKSLIRQDLLIHPVILTTVARNPDEWVKYFVSPVGVF